MRIKVNLENIIEYGLDTLTGNSRADLLAKAKELNDNGLEFYVKLPDVAGGDTEAPVDRNAFQHYASDLPVPDGQTHKQKSLNLTEQAYLNDPCYYYSHKHIDGSNTWVCVKHDAISKHSVDGDSHEPCTFIDPFTD